jgi:cytochrome c oxidase subunit 2
MSLLALNTAHHALSPAGPQAQNISALWWVFLATCVAVYVVTMLFVFVPTIRAWRQRRSPATPQEPATSSPPAATERRLTTVVWGAMFITVTILFGLLFGDVITGRRLHAMPEGEPLRIKLTARQWWWEVQYQDATPANILTDANEIHLPVGRVVQIELHSPDVIHSFWVPNLHGKKDIIPDHPTTIWLRADKPGDYWGQCAEFCGYQHAKMRLLVVAEPAEQFESWRQTALRPAGEPITEQQKRGREVFVRGTCLLCHTIAGTDARGRVGPDLTHIASRRMIASNWLPNRPGHLAGWIVDPQKVKPGVRMPQNPMPPENLRALLEYLESLK